MCHNGTVNFQEALRPREFFCGLQLNPLWRGNSCKAVEQLRCGAGRCIGAGPSRQPAWTSSLDMVV